MPVPTHLKHKPIIAVDNYDGDAEVLSIGLAQWENNKRDISAKVFRRAENGNWSRQSEELPLHRVIDLASLVLSSILMADKNMDTDYLNKEVVAGGRIEDIKNYYKNNKEDLDYRISELKKIISNL